MIRRHIFWIIHFFCINGLLVAQPSIQWQQSFGGLKKDSARSVKQTRDRGFIVIGYTLSTDGDITGPIGGGDWWILKISDTGEKEWERTLGGMSTESAYDVAIADDGGYVVVGETYSADVNVSFNHGDRDIWAVKLDSIGNIQWEKTYGGTQSESGYSIKQTPDQGFIICGSTSSNDGDISQYLGFTDVWVIKADKNGTIEWEQTYGGSDGDERGYCIDLTNDGGYIFTGETNSTNGDITEALGNTDAWVVKLNGVGEIQWQKTLGGFASDKGWEIKQSYSGEFVMVGYWGSGDAIPNWHGLYDYWLTKLDSNGNVIWERIYGGTNDDWAQTFGFYPNGDIVIAGATRSIDGDVTQNDGIQDIWLIKVDSNGTLLWEKSIGGNGPEIAFDLCFANESDVIIVGESSIVSGDVSSNMGSTDFWIVKLAPETSATQTPTAIPLNLYPNPATHWITLNLPIIEQDMQVNITDEQGKLLQSRSIRTDEKLDISALPSGVYWVSAVSKSGQVYAGKFVRG
ncbi:MAG: T9SS type A sorting domain-containing protein [Chitinophagales bacterium]|nr:T9SS type A sorting domain-containing protein [Chitinophagales bacterium]